MPLSELLCRVAKQKVDSSAAASSTDLSFLPENDFAELVWENGQIQPKTRGRKTIQSSQNPPKTGSSGSNNNNKDGLVGNHTTTSKLGKSGFIMDSVLGQIPVSVPSLPTAINQHHEDDDVVPWLNFSLHDSTQQDYCSEFLSDLSGITVNDHSSHNNLPSFDTKTGAHHSPKDSRPASSSVNGLGVDHGNLSKVSSREGQPSGHTSTSPQLYQLPSHQCQTSFPFLRTKIMGCHGDNITYNHHHALSGTSPQLKTSEASLPTIQAHKQLPISTTSTTTTLMNFSHFLPPSAVNNNKTDIQNNISGISSTGIIKSRDRDPTANNRNYDESTSIKSCIGLPKEPSSNCHPMSVPSKVGTSAVEHNDAEEPAAALPEIVIPEYDPNIDMDCYQNSGEQVTKEPADGEKIIEPVVASSSVCSGNNMDRVSDDLAQKLKRKHPETEESEGPSEDIEEESVHAKKPPTRGGSGSKRSRAAEVHNLSERRRRDRINEKMRALQELIPNCNKVDKASMLDEAIEYLKTLQLQVQIMSMGAGFYMPSMMLPHGMPHTHPPSHIAQFLPVGVGMGMNMGFGMCMPDANVGVSGCSMMQVPPMHGAHFQGQPFSGPTSFHGVRSNVQMLGLSGQGVPMQFPHAPLVPISGSPNLKATLGPHGCGVVESAPTSNAKDSIHNMCSKLTEANGTGSLINQCQTTNDCSEKSGLVQSEGNNSGATENEMEKSGNGNDKRTGCDGEEA